MKSKLFYIALFILISAPIAGYAVSTTTNNQESTDGNVKPLYWVDPMEPNVHYKAPGKSRMGMELVPVYPKEKKTP